MANSQDRQITIAGKTFTYRFSSKAMYALMDAWEVDEKEMSARLGACGVRDMPLIFWAGLRSHHPEVTLAEIEEMVDEGGVDGLKEATLQANEAASVRPKAGGPPPQKGHRTKTRSR